MVFSKKNLTLAILQHFLGQPVKEISLFEHFLLDFAHNLANQTLTLRSTQAHYSANWILCVWVWESKISC